MTACGSIGQLLGEACVPGLAEDPSFRSLLRQRRHAAGLTQVALARRAGLSERTIQDLERGISLPRRGTVHRLISALDGRSLLTPVVGSSASRLPPPITSFVGRERELAELRHLLGTCRRLTLTG